MTFHSLLSCTRLRDYLVPHVFGCTCSTTKFTWPALSVYLVDPRGYCVVLYTSACPSCVFTYSPYIYLQAFLTICFSFHPIQQSIHTTSRQRDQANADYISNGKHLAFIQPRCHRVLPSDRSVTESKSCILTYSAFPSNISQELEDQEAQLRTETRSLREALDRLRHNIPRENEAHPHRAHARHNHYVHRVQAHLMHISTKVQALRDLLQHHQNEVQRAVNALIRRLPGEMPSWAREIPWMMQHLP